MKVSLVDGKSFVMNAYSFPFLPIVSSVSIKSNVRVVVNKYNMYIKCVSNLQIIVHYRVYFLPIFFSWSR